MLLALVALLGFSGFWWLTMWLLLGGRIGRRQPVLALMSVLIAVGVVIILGALAGLLWRGRRSTRAR